MERSPSLEQDFALGKEEESPLLHFREVWDRKKKILSHMIRQEVPNQTRNRYFHFCQG